MKQVQFNTSVKMFLYGIVLFLPHFHLSASYIDLISQVQVCKQNYLAARAGDWKKAYLNLDKNNCPLIARYILWLDLKENATKKPFTAYQQFLTQFPGWPWEFQIRKNLEQASSENVNNKELIKWFDKNPPKTGKGGIRYINALMSVGQKSKAIEVMKQVWQTLDLDKVESDKFLKAYGSHLNVQDHKARFDYLLEGSNVKAAKALLPELKGQNLLLGKVKLAFREKSPQAFKLFQQLPKHLRELPEMMYHFIKLNRLLDRSEAVSLIGHVNVSEMPNPQKWWQEKHVLARDAIRDNKPHQAYALAHSHGANEGLIFDQGEWLAGWIALRLLKKPELALEHFKKLYKGVKTGNSRSRAAFWVAKTYKILKDKGKLLLWFKKGAQYKTVYYGQLCAKKIGETVKPSLISVSIADQKAIKQFENKQYVQMIRLIDLLDDHDAALPFIYVLAKEVKTVKEKHHLIAFTKEVIPQFLVEVSRLTGLVTRETYPIIDLPVLEKMPERPLIHAIIHKESGFYPRALSPAGAKGMMQLMTPTAKEFADKNNYSFREEFLFSKPELNVILGIHYLTELLKDFDQSYILALAAYNAGPGNVGKWLKAYGDPRDYEFDYDDWIELIPFAETRNYVQRVLSNLTVYRSLLS